MNRSCQKALFEILAVSRIEDLSKLKKIELWSIITRVKTIALAGIEGKEPDLPIRNMPDSRYQLAMGLVIGYRGNNSFMLSMREAAVRYGGMTEAQSEAVLSPPTADERRQLGFLGVDVSTVTYRWQGIDLLGQIRRETQQQAREDQ